MAAEERWYFSKEQLQKTPSRAAGVEFDKEVSYRQQAANFIQDMGQRLQVNQLCINTAIVYMHRFYMFHSFKKCNRNSISVCALFLAAKVEEQPRKLEHVIRVANNCLHREAPPLDIKSEEFLVQAQDLVINENIMLQTLGFDVAIDHPHTHVVKCCQLVRGGGSSLHQHHASKDLAQTSYFMATNSLHLTTMCLQYKPTVVACVCIHLACKWANWEIPKSSEGKSWFCYVDKTVTEALLEELTSEFLAILDRCPSRLKRKMLSSTSVMEKMPDLDKKPNDQANASGDANDEPSTSSKGDGHFNTPIPSLVRDHMFGPKYAPSASLSSSKTANAVDKNGGLAPPDRKQHSKKEQSQQNPSARPSTSTSTNSTAGPSFKQAESLKTVPDHRHAPSVASASLTDFPPPAPHNSSESYLQPPTSQPHPSSPASAAVSAVKKHKPSSKEYREYMEQVKSRERAEKEREKQPHPQPPPPSSSTSSTSSSHQVPSSYLNRIDGLTIGAAAVTTTPSVENEKSKQQQHHQQQQHHHHRGPAGDAAHHQGNHVGRRGMTTPVKPAAMVKPPILTPSPPSHRDEEFQIPRMDAASPKMQDNNRMATPPTPLLPVACEALTVVPTVKHTTAAPPPVVKHSMPAAAKHSAPRAEHRKREREESSSRIPLPAAELPPAPKRRHDPAANDSKERQVKPHKSKTPPVIPQPSLELPLPTPNKRASKPEAAEAPLAPIAKTVSQPPAPLIAALTVPQTPQPPHPKSDYKHAEQEISRTVASSAGHVPQQPLPPPSPLVIASNANAVASHGAPVAKNSSFSSTKLDEMVPQPHSRLLPPQAAKDAKPEPLAVPAVVAAAATAHPQPPPTVLTAVAKPPLTPVVKTPHQSSKREKKHKTKSRHSDKERSHDKRESSSSSASATPSLKLTIPKERIKGSSSGSSSSNRHSSEPHPGSLKLKISKERVTESSSSNSSKSNSSEKMVVRSSAPPPPPETTNAIPKLKISAAGGSFTVGTSESKKRERDSASRHVVPEQPAESRSTKMPRQSSRSARRGGEDNGGNGHLQQQQQPQQPALPPTPRGGGGGGTDVPPSSNTRSSRQDASGFPQPLMHQQQQHMQQPPQPHHHQQQQQQRGRKGNGPKPMVMQPQQMPQQPYGHQMNLNAGGGGGGYPAFVPPPMFFPGHGMPPQPNMHFMQPHGEYPPQNHAEYMQPPPHPGSYQQPGYFTQFPPMAGIRPAMQFSHPPPMTTQQQQHLMQQQQQQNQMPPLPREPPPTNPPPPPPLPE